MKSIYTNLVTHLILATLVGAIFGFLLPQYNLAFDSFGGVLVTIIKMAVLPYLCFSIIYHVGLSKKARWSRPFKLLLTTFIALFIAFIPLLYAFTFPYFAEMPKGNPEHVMGAHWAQSIAKGFTHSIVENAIPWALLATLVLGFIITRARRYHHLKPAHTLSETLSVVTFALLRITPLAAFAITAARVGRLNQPELALLSPFIVPFILCSLFTTLLLTPYFLRFFSRFHYRTIVKQLALPLLLAFSTGSAFITIPFLIKSLENLLSDKTRNTRLRVLAPIAALVPLWNLMFIACFASFILHTFSITGISQTKTLLYSLLSYFTFLVSPLESVYVILETFPLPGSAAGIFLKTYSIISPFIALLSVASTFILVSLTELRWKGALQSPFKEWSWKNTAQVAVIGTFVLAVTVYYQPTQKRVENPLKDLSIKSSKAIFTNFQLPTNIQARSKNKDRLEEIRHSNEIRVGYSSTTPPFCYINQQGQLVGYDIAHAYELARSLGVNITFVPINYSTIASDLKAGRYDIAMSAVTETDDRSQSILFSKPVLKVETALTLRNDVQNNDMRMLNRIAILKGTSYEAIGKQLFSPSQIVLVDDYDVLLNDSSIQAALWTREESLAWQQDKQGFQTVRCQPSLGSESFSYATAKESESLAAYVNQWLDMKRSDGFSQEQFQKWILRTPNVNFAR